MLRRSEKCKGVLGIMPEKDSGWGWGSKIRKQEPQTTIKKASVNSAGQSRAKIIPQRRPALGRNGQALLSI